MTTSFLGLLANRISFQVRTKRWIEIQDSLRKVRERLKTLQYHWMLATNAAIYSGCGLNRIPVGS